MEIFDKAPKKESNIYMDNFDTNEMTPQIIQSHTPSLTSGGNSTGLLMSEINFALGLPFKERASAEEKGIKGGSSLVKISNEKVNNILKIEAKSRRGSLSARAYDVLNALLHLASQQLSEKKELENFNINEFKVFYSTAEICEILKMNKTTSQGKISKAIDELMETQLELNGHIFQLETKTTTNIRDKIHLIRKIGHQSVAVPGGGDHISLKYAELEPFLVSLLDKGFEVNMKYYLALRPGKERRAYFFIYGKRGVFGNVFSFDMEELSTVIGDSGKRQDVKKRNATRVLERIRDKVPGMSFVTKVKYGTKSMEIMIKFQSEDLNSIKYETPQYRELVEFYGLKALEDLGLSERAYIQLEKVLSKKADGLEYDFFKEKIPAADFTIDLVLWQIIKTDYKTTNFSGLANIVLSNVIDDTVSFPNGYEHFVTKRNKDERDRKAAIEIEAKILERQEKIKLEEEREDKNFKVYFEEYIEKNKKYLQDCKDLATKLLEQEEGYTAPVDQMEKIIFDQRLERKTYECAKEDYYSNGDIFRKHSLHGAREIRSDQISNMIENSAMQAEGLIQ